MITNKTRFLGLIILFLTQVLIAQQNTIVLNYDTSGYQEKNESFSSKKKLTDYTLIPAVQAEMNVSDNGALTYNVPLESMKGINNFQPNLSIAYNSQNGNGAAGWGWNLVGLSTISRGGKSKEIDGITIGVQFNDNDPYYLDGQRLLQKNSTEYVTKNFSTIKITKSTGDYSFVVRYTDGKIAYYKELISGQNYIVKMVDAFNNEIHYSYTVESNSPRIDKISYGGSDALSDKFYLNISYASRHKPIKIYRNSQQFISGKVISEIISGSTYTGDYRKYTFNYDFVEGGNIERLRTIMVFNEIGESLKPLNFNYNSANSTGTALTTKRQLATVPANTWKLNDVSAGNFYDSGETDTFFITTTVNDFRSGPNGPVTGAPETPPGSLRNPIFYLNGPFGPVPPSTYVDAHTRLFTGKTLINNNKITANDQLIIVNTRSKTSVSEQGIIEIKDFKTGVTKILNGGPSIPWGSTYQGSLRISHKMLIPGDFDNDGLFDFIHVQGNIQGSQKIYLYEVGKETTNTITRKEFVTTNLFLTEDNFRLLELDGDGIPEIMVNSGNQYAFYKINTVDLTIKPFGDLLGQSSSNILHDLSYDENGKLITPFLMGDFNGDGLTDFVTPRKVFGNVNPFSKLRAYIENEDPNSFKWWLYTSDGKKFIPTELDLSAQKLAYIKPSADDSVAPKQSSWDLFLWGQDQQGAKEYAVANVIVTDINNDGKSDLVSVSRFGRIKYNDPNPLISNTTWENVSDVYTEFIYDRGCFNQIGGAIPATYDIYSHSWKCTDPNFPTLISPTTTSNGHLTIPVPYVTILPNFNKIKFYLNTSEGNSFQKLNQEVDIQTEKITPFSLFLTSNNVNFLNSYRSSVSNFDVTTGTELKITFNNDNFLEKQIQEVNNGSTVLQKIEYRPMIQLDSNEEVSYQYKENDLTYPLYVHKTNGSLYLVNKIHTLFGGKILTKEYRFENVIQSLDGKGFLGFQKTYSSDAYESILQNGKYRNKKLVNALFWTVNTRDAQMDNALVTKTYGGLTKFLTQSTLTNHKYVTGNQSIVLTTDEVTMDNLRKITTTKKFTYDEADQFKLKKSVENYNDEASSETVIQYEPEFNNGQHYFYGKIKEVITTAYKDGDSFTTKDVNIYYPENGAIKETKKYSQNSQAIIRNYIYNLLGNLTEESISTAGIATQTSTYGYDITNRFLATTTTPDGLTASMIVNPLGRTTEETAALGGLKTYFNYDNWGNITSTTDYLGKTTTISKSVANGVAGGIYQISRKREGGIESISTYDEFDREIQSKFKSINGKWIVKKTEFDIYGKVKKYSEPFFEGETVKWNNTEYDSYKRPIKETTYTGKIITSCYEGLKVTIEEGHQKKSKTFDALGNTVRYQDYGGIINYNYFPNGKLKQSNYEGSVTVYEIDDWGNKKKVIDPSAGTFTYEYDNLGRLLKSNSPKGYTIFKYDDLGRTEFEKTYGNTPDENTNIEKFYQYNNTTKLPEKIYGTNNGKSFSYTTEYDQYFRIKGKKEETPDFIYSNTLTFDSFGRLDETLISTKLLINGFTTTSKTKNVYNDDGILVQQNDLNSNIPIWHTSSVNSLSQVVQMEFGNGYAINNYYNSQENSLLKSTHSNGSNTVIDINYDFDVNKGVLRSRNNVVFNKNESFNYDLLNRLTKETLNGVTVNEYSYDKRGRMTGNSEIGQYTYSNSDYKLQHISFNSNGQQVEVNRGFAEFKFNEFNAPISIKIDTRENLNFEYNLMKGRYSMTSTVSNEKKLYSSDSTIEIKRKYGNTGEMIEIITYITGDPYSANYIKKDILNLTQSTHQANNYYLHRDHLGSILAITNTDGTVAEKRFFDAWGNIRGFINQNNQLITDYQQIAATYLITDRGYTGHEHLWKSGLINMNARIYDPIIRRFVTPDNILQDSFNTQNYNKYGYVYNNPLFYKDPSGNIALPAAIFIAVAVSATTHAIINTINGIPFYYGMGQAMVKGASSAIITFGVGSVATSIFGTTVSVGKAVFEAGMHGLTSGLMSEADGGKFISGFASGTMSSLVASGIQAIGQTGARLEIRNGSASITTFGSRNSGLIKAMTLTTGALAGGLSATIAGGKFIDGFKQGLIVAGLNHLAHTAEELSEDATEWKTASMEIKAEPRQTGETDCVPTIARAAAKYLGIETDVTTLQQEANRIGGIKANQTKEYFEALGLKVSAIFEAKAKNDYYFHTGIPGPLVKQVIQFIVESLNNSHPVYLGFSDTSMASNGQGHAVLVTQIKYSADFTKLKNIDYYDPATGKSSGQLQSLQNPYGNTQTVYNVFSFSKP